VPHNALFPPPAAPTRGRNRKLLRCATRCQHPPHREMAHLPSCGAVACSALDCRRQRGRTCLPLLTVATRPCSAQK
jgi:hypothetical protein